MCFTDSYKVFAREKYSGYFTVETSGSSFQIYIITMFRVTMTKRIVHQRLDSAFDLQNVGQSVVIQKLI
jgi:hypothetical protein